MRISARHYAESLLAAKNAGKRSTPELVAGLVHILQKNGETKLLPQIVETLVAKEAEEKKVVNVVIETATRAEPKTVSALLKRAESLYPGLKIEGEFVVNPDLKAGFRIRGKDKALDQSLHTRLNKLRNHLS